MVAESEDAMAAYVKEKGGTRAVRKVLIANNGMAATKAIMSMRRWAYETLGDERALTFAVMATPEDLNANAEFVRLADEYVNVPGGSNVNNYANVRLIVDTAKRVGADAVWPGWGHASENPKLPRALKAAGIVFMGPPAPVMSVLGDKIAANILAQTAKVPSIPWSGSFGDDENDDGPLQAKLTEDGTIPEDTFRKACVADVDEALRVAERVGYPVMLKASEGGGGKGIRMNQDARDLAANFPQVAAEVPGSPIFLMQLVTGARHLEVQVVGDEHGNAIALNGRDCSTQRRFQKIFEEGPPTKPTGGIAVKEIFDDMQLKAKELVKSIGYVGAGTVEYLYDSKTDEYYFLELNPRLQVEHPVTEGLTKVNIPATQLQVSMGIPLSNIPQIRNLYGYQEEDWRENLLDLNTATYELEPDRHVLAARITAENPDEGFKPTSGKITRVVFQSTPAVWGYFSVGANGGVHEFADSQFGHLFATGKDREAARKAMVLALKELKVWGDIRNPVEYLVQLLETEAFKANDIDTAWLDGLLKEKALQDSAQVDDDTIAACAALFRAHERSKRAKRDFHAALDQGQFGTSSAPLFDDYFDVDVVVNDVRYDLNVKKTGAEAYSFTLKNNIPGGGSSDAAAPASFSARAREQPDGTLLASVAGRAMKVAGLEEPLGLRLVIDGATIFVPTTFDPSEVRSDVTGKLVRWLVEDGKEVDQGAPFAEVEAMKMIMPLRAAEKGSLKHAVSPGSVIETGDLLASLDLADASKAKQIRYYDGDFGGVLAKDVDEDTSSSQQVVSEDALRAYEESVDLLKTALAGFDALGGTTTPEDAVGEMIAHLKEGPILKLALRRAAGAIGQKMPAALDAELAALKDESTVADLVARVDEVMAEYDGDAALDPIRAVLDRWRAGAFGVAIADVASLLEGFLAVEERYAGRPNEDAATRELIKGDASLNKDQASDVIFAHAKLQRRAAVVNALIQSLDHLRDELLEDDDDDASGKKKTFDSDSYLAVKANLENQLERIAALEVAGPGYAGIALAAGMARLESTIPPFDERVEGLRDELLGFDATQLQAFATRPELGSYQRGVDLLVSLFDDPKVARAAAEVYVRRMYSAHDMLKVDVGEAPDGSIEAKWWYKYRSDDPKGAAPLRFGKLVRCTGTSMDDALAKVGDTVLPAYAKDVEDFKSSGAADQFGDDSTVDVPVNTLHVLLSGAFLELEDQDLVSTLGKKTEAVQAQVTKAGLRSINFIASEPPLYPRSFTYVLKDDASSGAASGAGEEDSATTLVEDPLRRSMRPTFYHLLELDVLSDHYALTPLNTVNRDLRIYVGDEKAAKNPKTAGQCVFVRRVTHSTDLNGGGAERLFDKALDALEMAQLDARVKPTSSASLWLTVIPPVVATDVASVDAAFKDIVGGLIASRAARLLAARVDDIQIKMYVALDEEKRKEFAGDPSYEGPVVSTSPLAPQTKYATVRCVASSGSGPWLQLKTYLEVTDAASAKNVGYCELDGTNCVVDPYPTADVVAKKRAAARRVGTTYAYDFVGLLASATLASWTDRAKALAPGGTSLQVPPVDQLVDAKELLFDDDDAAAPYGVSSKESRLVGTNDVGMVAWDCTFKTPEYPAGRRVVLLANDVTYKSGSFGVLEDDFFAKVSRFAASQKIPRIYLSSNSGARIGLVDALKNEIGVKWVDDGNPNAGFHYLYLTPSQLASLPEGSVEVKPKNKDGVHELTAIIGAEDQVPDGIGVENLRGSGTIAGVTSLAYKDTFTLSYVSGRSVGIGAYLVRLGQRVIQMKQGPMILTGYSALNKLLGKPVYTSQDQLGGPQIMFPNGITHEVVNDDYDGARAIIDWLSFVPDTTSAAAVKGSSYAMPPVLEPLADPVDRPVTAKPPKAQGDFDVRTVLDSPDGGGFFDTGSFRETLGGWGKTVVAGRARLGGIPFGVIAVETRTVEAVVPADPANPDSRETVLPQAGCVWYPDSAYKTAQAIEDFKNGEHLPLLIFANWRGFSGGTRDMFSEVLKFGAKIVDALTEYDRPVFVYIPPYGELRGGAWVVVDPTIGSPYMMEMYADPESRGGILEPSGIVEVKFRDDERKSLMKRIDPSLDALDGADREKRIRDLGPAYLQVATEFADLHDRAGRMKAKGVIRDVVPWESSRHYFYWRATRRLAVDALATEVAQASGGTFEAAVDAVRAFCDDKTDWDDDKAVATFLAENTTDAAALVAGAKKQALLDQFHKLAAEADPELKAQAQALLAK